VIIPGRVYSHYLAEDEGARDDFVILKINGSDVTITKYTGT